MAAFTSGRVDWCRQLQPNKAFEQTVKHRGRTVRACMCARAGAEIRQWSAAQLGR